MEKFTVSIHMITYNHEKFIVKAIESILKQKVNFNLELVISNDASSDKSDELIKPFLKRIDKITFKYFNHRKNLGVYKNFIFSLQQCTGKYIALCEGDDYWTDPLKLQKQVDFLEANPEYEVCFTNINIINAIGEEVKERLITHPKKTTYTQEDLPLRAPTLTRVFKNRDFSNLPEAPGMDSVLLLYQSQFGKIKYIDEITGAYRQHDQGAYSSGSKTKRKEHTFLTLFACLQLLKPPLLYKYYGMLFKKLVELKRLDVARFKEHRFQFLEEYKTKKSSFSKKEQKNIDFGFLLLKIPFFERSKLLSKGILILLNRMFIY